MTAEVLCGDRAGACDYFDQLQELELIGCIKASRREREASLGWRDEAESACLHHESMRPRIKLGDYFVTTGSQAQYLGPVESWVDGERFSKIRVQREITL